MQRTFRNLFSSRSSRKPSNRLNRIRLSRPLSLSLLEDRSVPTVVTSALDTGVAGELRDAITLANANPGNATFTNISFAPGLAGQTITLALGEMLVTTGVNITGFTTSPGVPNLTIDGALASRAFQLNDTSGVVTFAFSGLSIINCSGTDYGGAISLTSINDNVSFTDCTFSANKSANMGGAFGARNNTEAALGTVTITRCNFLANANNFNFGGAIALDAVTTSGATNGWKLNITDSVFDGNTTVANGGAVFMRAMNMTTTVTGTTFSNNTNSGASFGGAFSFLTAPAGTATFSNCTFFNNATGAAGGAVSNGGGASGNIFFYNSTFNSNASGTGGGAFAASSGAPTVRFESSILFGNLGGTGKSDFSAANIQAKNSIIEDKTGGTTFTDLGGNLYGAANNPILGPLQNNGGLTATMIPGPFSPAREAGTNALSLPNDQRGAGFPRLLGAKNDIGAVESQDPNPLAAANAADVLTGGGATYTFTVTYSDDLAIKTSTVIGNNAAIQVTGPGGFSQLATYKSIDNAANGTPRTATYEITAPVNGLAGFDPTDNGTYAISVLANQISDNDPTINFVNAGQVGSFSVGVAQTFTVTNTNDAGAGSLRQAVLDANAFVGSTDKIQFSALFNSAQTITLSSGEMLVSDPLNIVGPSNAAFVTVDGGATSRIFNLNGPGSISVSISGMTMKNGGGSDGGAISIDSEIVTLSNVVFNANAASASGGAIFLNQASAAVTATDCVFTGNIAGTFGGAIARLSNGAITLTRCTFTGNSATNDGGAIRLDTGSLTINSSLFANNNAGGAGGAIAAATAIGTFVISNTTITQNTAVNAGGGVTDTHYGGSVKILNSTIYLNVGAGTGQDYSHTGNNGGSTVGGMVITSSIIGDLNSPGAGYPTNILKSIIQTQTSSGGTVFDDGGNFFGVDPALGTLANNGGPTQTMGLLPGSPAIDAGQDQSPSLGFDQRGTGFPRQVGPAVDIGAFEGTLPVPGGSLTPVATIVTPGPLPNTVTVTYTDAVFNILGSSIGVSDIQILDESLNPLTITGISPPAPGNSNPLVITYTFTPPTNLVAGQWDNSDNGTYTVKLNAGEVSNTNGVFNAVQTLGSFKAAMLTTYTVINNNDADVGTGFTGDLRYTINKANADKGPSIINFDSTFFASAKTITMALGEMAVTAEVTINGPTAKATVDAANAGRVFNINDAAVTGGSVSISNLIITKGSTTGVNGGAVFVNGDESVTFTGVTISNSTTDSDGGGIFGSTNSTLRFVNSTVSGNSATGAASQGGGINVGTNGNLLFENSTLSGNTSAGDGGGFYFLNGGSLLVSQSTVSGNKADTTIAGFGGGGGYFFGAANAKGVLVTSSTFTGNTSGLGLGGGGLMFQNASGSMIIENSTFSGNTANTGAGGGYGGGVLGNAFGPNVLIIRNSTVAGNEAGKGGGGFSIGATGAQSISSTIFAGNTVGGVGTVATADLSSVGAINVTGNNNLIGVQDAGTKMTFTGTGNLTGTAATPLNAQLNALASNGGPTQTRSLQSTSPALNAGNNTAGLSFDQRGTGFPRSVGLTDIGAFEDQTKVGAKVTAITINSTKTGAEQTQRSRVFDVAITFDSPVTFATTAGNAFTLTRVGGGSVTLAGAVSGNTVTLTFTGGTVDNLSLADGRYDLVALAGQFTGSGIDGTGPGDATAGDNYNFLQTTVAPVSVDPTRIFRIFGDFTGDGAVAANDFIQFRLALGGSSPIFDFDNDGAVAASDFIQFRIRFGGSI